MNQLRSKDGRSILPMDLSAPMQRRISALAVLKPGTAKRGTTLPPAAASSVPGGSDAVAYKPVPDQP